MSLEKYRAIVVDQQRKIDRLVQARGVAPVRRVLEEILRELERTASSLPDSFSSTVRSGMLAQTRAAMARFVARGATALDAASAAAMAEASSQAFQLLSTMEHQFTGAVVAMPIAEIAILKRASPRASSLLSVHRRSLARYGARMVMDFESQTAIGLALGETTSQIIDRVTSTANLEWWQGERIVRTEMSYAYNAGHRDAIEAEAEEFDGDVWAQWSEHATADGAPLDNRVKVDSLAMHGQVAASGQVFTQPPTSPVPDADGETEVPERLVGQTWEHPPNRPNDRSVLVPWRAHWGVPGWVWRDGRRVPMGGGGRSGSAAPAPAPTRDRRRPAAEGGGQPDGFDWRTEVDGHRLWQEPPEVRHAIPSHKEAARRGADTMYVARPSELAGREIVGVNLPGQMRDRRIASVKNAWENDKGLAALEILIDRRGRMFVADGNHRLQAAAEDGDRPVAIRFKAAAGAVKGDDIRAELLRVLAKLRRALG